MKGIQLSWKFFCRYLCWCLRSFMKTITNHLRFLTFMSNVAVSKPVSNSVLTYLKGRSSFRQKNKDFRQTSLREKCPNTEFFLVRIFSVSVRIQSECGKIPTRKTPYSVTFHAVYVPALSQKFIITVIKELVIMFSFIQDQQIKIMDDQF